MMSPIENFLNYLSQFHPLSEPLIEYLNESIREEIYPKNHKLLEKGQIANQMWFLIDGRVRVSRRSSLSSRDLTIWFFNPLELIIPFCGVGNQNHSPFQIITARHSSMLSISHAHLKYLNILFPEFHIISKGFLESTINVLSQHLDLVQHGSSGERYTKLMESNPSLFHQATLKDIASFLGVSIATLKHLRYDKGTSDQISS